MRSKVTITVVREGTKEPFDVSLMREVLQVQSIKTQELEPGIGYIRIRQFQEVLDPDYLVMSCRVALGPSFEEELECVRRFGREVIPAFKPVAATGG